MQHYFIRRLIMMIPLMLLISFVAFSLINLVSSDPAETMLRINNITVTDEAVKEARQALGLDKPFLLRYALWLYALLQGDLGKSFLSNQNVWDEITQAFPATFYLAVTAFAVIFLLSLTLSLLCMLMLNSLWDKIIRGILFFFTALPNYWLALLFIWLFSVRLNWLPSNGLEQKSGIILPALTLSLGYIGVYVRLLRGAMLNQLQQPYVFYARTRGLSEKQILFKHILQNSLHTSYIAMGMSIPKLLAGSVIIENIFALPGLGRLCIQAIFGRDYPVIQAYILLMAMLFLVGNFVIDWLQHRRDPRIKRGY
ncbi:nickel/cobalt ABC transporter permease [Basfia succiniciproducens]|uniref:Nickel transport system permease protein n=1 Tax=Basfia succiniciproducens TaxID=653940 RepID=A0A1G5DEQ0_9PAST|nr:nickel/cobalt ABC transporter permease [Basfia succiniciproducens]QIM67932.1 nickel ABC transporter permease subunit NikB [Basfia succiniciproducens]SCY13222.1 nickel transport system permease protein [Basfia succiniciproducens]